MGPPARSSRAAAPCRPNAARYSPPPPTIRSRSTSTSSRASARWLGTTGPSAGSASPGFPLRRRACPRSRLASGSTRRGSCPSPPATSHANLHSVSCSPPERPPRDRRRSRRPAIAAGPANPERRSHAPAVRRRGRSRSPAAVDRHRDRTRAEHDRARPRDAASGHLPTDLHHRRGRPTLRGSSPRTGRSSWRACVPSSRRRASTWSATSASSPAIITCARVSSPAATPSSPASSSRSTSPAATPPSRKARPNPRPRAASAARPARAPASPPRAAVRQRHDPGGDRYTRATPTAARANPLPNPVSGRPTPGARALALLRRSPVRVRQRRAVSDRRASHDIRGELCLMRA